MNYNKIPIRRLNAIYRNTDNAFIYKHKKVYRIDNKKEEVKK